MDVKVTVDKLSQEMSSSKTLNYISQLESEQDNLRKQLVDLSNQLKNSKVRTINVYT